MESWKACIAKKYITKTKPNRSMAIQMERMALLREDFLQHHVDQKYIVLKLEAYYDIVKELLYSNLYKNGYTCSNPQCLVGYFEHHLRGFKKEYGLIEELFSLKLKMHRIPPQKIQDFLQKNEELLKKTISLLKERLRALG
ncbi:hypothetical protein HZC31_06050 [Candidatus Woesearchaeota archaeon]|nr:hypothetical protein [Candidatus Woesearchaeota archaeon]